MGMQGSGKGTQASFIRDNYGFKVITTGEIIRDEMARHTPLGNKVRELMNSGNLVSDDLAFSIVKSRINDKENFLLDGFPRTIKQAQMLDEDFDVGGVIVLDLDEKTAIKRLVGRQQCSNTKCNAIYGPSKQPKRKGLCDICSSPLMTREDDEPLAIKRRISLYNEQTLPIINYYKKKNLLHIVDGKKAINNVSDEIEGLFGNVIISAS